MTIRQSIRDALRAGPMTIDKLAKVTGHDRKSVENSKHYLNAEGYIRAVKGKPGYYELTPIPQSHHGNVLTSPAWVPPKPMHRPTFDAPGCRIVERLTGQVLHG